MRLLHVYSYEIREFVEGNVPDYAILSHTWGEQEVTYKDMTKGNAAKLKGYQKILGCCDQSRLDGFEYVASVSVFACLLLSADISNSGLTPAASTREAPLNSLRL